MDELFLLLTQDDSVTPTVVVPVGTLGGLISRFAATEELMDLAPGGMRPGVPSGAVPVPYVVATKIGEQEEIAAGGRRQVRVKTERFQLAITTGAPNYVLSAENIREALEDHFNPVVISGDPISLRKGTIVSAWTEGGDMVDDIPMPDKSNTMVRRMLVTLTAIVATSQTF